MKKCAYCGKELTKKNRTKEHIIPNGLIKLFPNQNITFTPDKAYKDNFGQSISDVCQSCNGGVLSDLDTYGVNLIKTYFLKTYNLHDILNVNFDCDKLSRWLIKIAYNDARISKEGVNWFIKNMDYILGKSSSHSNFSILAGINVDMNPLGEENDLYLPLNINTDLEFYPLGCIPYETMVFGIKSNRKIQPLNLKEIYKSYSFRFGSAKFILILWKNSASNEEIDSTKKLIEKLFPYKDILNDNLILEKVNDAFLSRYTNLIIGNEGLSISDSKVISLVPNFKDKQEYLREAFKKINANSEIDTEKLIMDDYNKNLVKEK